MLKTSIKKLEIFLINLSKRQGMIRKILRTTVNTIRRIQFNKYRNIEINNKAIIFESFLGQSYTDTPKALYEYMIKSDQFKNYNFIWAFKNPEVKAEYFQHPNTKLVQWGSDDYYRSYASAKYWISNSAVPIHIKKKPEQVYIQTWHGTPLKKLRCDIEVTGSALNDTDDNRKRNDQDARRFDYFISPSACLISQRNR